MAKTKRRYVCQECGSVSPLAGAMRRLRGVEHAGRGCAGDGVLAEARPVERRAGDRVRAAQRAGRSCRCGNRPALPSSTARWAAGWCRAVGGADGRRSRHRQVHAAAAGGRADGARRCQGRLCQRRGSRRAGAPARRSPAGLAKRRSALAAETSVRDILTTLGQGRRRAAGDRFDPDHAFRHDRRRARHGQPGARLRAGTDPLRQGKRLRAGAGRPCHQGRQHRRPARARAHGRPW
jgi:hypothetical protein